ncbi:tetratricopeptide repeat protein [Deinococcus cavernae]|nr:tetratricopeptide repeat protein [Deinococcus cavernae]
MWRTLLILTVFLTGGVDARLSATPPGSLQIPPIQGQLIRVQQELLTPDEVIALMNSGKLDRAERAARAAMQAHPESARSRLLLARVLARQGDLMQARAMLAQARALPQWKQQNLGVPYPTPDELDRLVRSDPARSLDVLADVLLALGDDPKAYFLQARAYGELGQWQKGRAALERARALNPGLDFASPSVLAALDQALADELPVEKPDTSLSDVKFGDDGNPVMVQETPWWQRAWVWWTVGILSALAGWFTVSFTRWKKQREVDMRRTISPMNLQLAQEIQATEQQLFMREDAEARRKLGRLRNLQGQVGAWLADPLSFDPPRIQVQFDRLWNASLSDASYAAYAYQQEEAERVAREAAEEARKAAEEKARRDAMPARSESSFSSRDSGSSWSNGSSSSSTDNSGGSSW